MSAAYSPAASAGLQAWERRRTWSRTWSRNDTARWLDERSPAIVQHFKREHGVTFGTLTGPRQAGQWLRVRLPKNFDLIHERLRAAEDRERMTLKEVLP